MDPTRWPYQRLPPAEVTPRFLEALDEVCRAALDHLVKEGAADRASFSMA